MTKPLITFIIIIIVSCTVTRITVNGNVKKLDSKSSIDVDVERNIELKIIKNDTIN